MPKSKRNGSKKGTSNSSYLRQQEDGEKYAEVTKACGHGRFNIKFLDGEEANAKLKGSMSKRRTFTKVEVGHIVLAQLDPSTTGKDNYFIVHRYSPDEKRKLTRMGELDVFKEVVDDNPYEFEDDETNVKSGEVVLDSDFIDDI